MEATTRPASVTNGRPDDGRPIRDDDVIAAVISAEAREGGFTELPSEMSVGPDLRSTYFSVLFLQEFGGLTEASKQAAIRWTDGLRDGSGWFVSDGALEPIDVAINAFRLAEALGIGLAPDSVDATRLFDAARADIGPDWLAFRVMREAWAKTILEETGGATPDQMSTLEAEVLSQLPRLDVTDVRTSVGVAQLPVWVPLEPATRTVATETLRDSVLAAAGHPGPWDEQLWALLLLGGGDKEVFTKMFDLLGSGGAPRYWGMVSSLDAYLLQAGQDYAPVSWGEDWLAKLRRALLSREFPAGGFGSPVTAPAGIGATAAAVITLHYAGGQSEIESRMDAIVSILCSTPPKEIGDPNLIIGVVRYALDLLDDPCKPPAVDSSYPKRPVDHWIAAIAGNTYVQDAACPVYIGDTATDRILLLLNTFSVEPGMRKDHLAACGVEDLIVDAAPASVMELYAFAGLRLMDEVPLDREHLGKELESFRLGLGFGTDGAASVGETCQAMVLRQMLATTDLIQLVCLVG